MSECKKCYNVIPSVHYFYGRTKMLLDFQICISVPLTDFVGWTLIALTESLKQTLFLQTGLPEEILLALTNFVE